MNSNFLELFDKLNYNFRNKEILKNALTLGFGDHFKGYERLEFLGDRVLGLTIASILFEKFEEEEGSLARRFAELTKAETLAIIAKQLHVEKYVFCAHNEKFINLTDSVLSDLCEALIAAVYIDSNFETAEKIIRSLWMPFIDSQIKPPVDSKTKLQEIVQAKKLPLPVYVELERIGPDHNPIFKMQVNVKGFCSCIAEGKSKKEASQKAAEKMIWEIKKND